METSKIADTSSSSSSSGWRYEVFLSFCGKDTRTNFTDHLYFALVDAGIQTFRDDDELRTGEVIHDELVTAIEQSRIAIPIFSENYASSKWCLNELALIFKCRRTMNQIVLPIFYHVEPSDVRNQTGSYAEAFEKHQMRFDQTTMQMWKEALREVGGLKGWSLENLFNGHEGKLIKSIVTNVWSTLNKTPLIVSHNLVGIQSHTEKILQLLCIGSDDRKIVGIHGLGGIGKTTIARAVYNTVFNNFEGCSFIANVRETAQQHNGLVRLQNQLVFDILKQENRNINSVDDGINVIGRRLRKKTVLIVLDDVDQDSEVNALVGNREWFGSGSKIIITSRNKDILYAQKADGIYEPNVLDLDQSLQLFSYHAFRSEQPPKDYLDLSKAVVKTTGGLPLALQVVGSSLFLKEKSIWQGTLEKLQKVPKSEILERLRISYDGLDYEEKQMFLDVACFFIGMNKNIACYIWEGCNFSPQIGLDVLCLRSLVKIGENGELRMHDLLRDLGREIVRQENINEAGKRSRIWSEEEVLDVLNTQTGTRKIEGISIDFRHGLQSPWLMSEGFATMTKLRLLRVDYAEISGDLENPFSQLRWLSWRRCPEQFTLTNFRPLKLVVLDLSYSEITENWMGWDHIKMAANLKVLHVTSCQKLSRTPCLSANQCLEVLILRDCRNLIKINPSIAHLSSLVILDMNGCERLMELPNEICHLSSLKRLDLRECKGLKKLPENLGYMEALEDLWIDRTYVEQLPDSIGNLKYLETLTTSFSPISEGGGIGRLSCWETLKTLDLSGCKLESLPKLPSSLRSLKALNCKSMTSFPMLSNLTNLEALSLEKCMLLKIPTSDIEKLSKLETLQLSDNAFRYLPPTTNALTSLKVLCLEGCLNLRRVSNLPPSLSILNVKGCTSIRYISDLPSTLISLNASGCELMKRLSATTGLRNLEILRLDRCRNLEKIEGIGEGLQSLDLLTMSKSRWLSLKEKLSDWKKLRELELGGEDISEIEGLESMDSLEKLKIEDSPSLRQIPKMSELKRLRILEINHCKKLSEIEGLEDLESLEQLQLRDCDSIIRLPGLSNLKKLERFIFSSLMLSEIESFEGLEFLVNLRHLEIGGCISMQRVPDLSNLNKLRKLKISYCEKLIEIPGLNRLGSLRSLNLRKCLSIEILPDLSSLTNLKELSLEGCNKLTEIQGVNRLEFLEKLEVGNCESLENLPDLSSLKYLKHLRAPKSRIASSENSPARSENSPAHSENSLDLSSLKYLKHLRASKYRIARSEKSLVLPHRHHKSSGFRRLCDFYMRRSSA